MAIKHKIYKVTAPNDNIALVSAFTAKGAVAHVVGQFFSATLATQTELVALVQAGVQVEVAGATDDAQQGLIGQPQDAETDEQPE